MFLFYINIWFFCSKYFNRMKVSKPIVLVGMMGCGKTSMGKLIAQELRFDFIDTDVEIEKKFNLSIKDIFANYGEKHFRKVEFDIFKLFKNRNDILISSGGGSFCQNNTYKLIKKRFLSVWLDVNEETILKRVKRNQNKRPLIKGLNEIDLKNTINDLMFKRKDCYSKADLRIQLQDLKMDKTFKKIYSEIKMYATK